MAVTHINVVDCIRKFTINGQVCERKSTQNTFAVANNQSVVAAVTGQRILVLGWKANGTTAAVGVMQFKSASGGTMLTHPIVVPSNAAGNSDLLPINDTGWIETNTGEGLFVDITGAAVGLTLFYLTYTP